LRWFSFTRNHIYSIPNRTNFERYRVKYPVFTEYEVDEDRRLIKIIHPQKGGRSFYLMAPSDTILEAVLEKVEKIIANHAKDDELTKDILLQQDDTSPDFKDGDAHSELIDFPSGGSFMEIGLFIMLLPLRVVLHWTLPDVRSLDADGNPRSSLGKAFLSVFSCLIWLIIGSYAMVSSLESLAALMNIPDTIIGVTVSAAGTSLPNFVASRIAAQNGFGNMAVSNAFGSNTFNIMVGLGLPWVLYTSFATGFKPYHALRNEGITESVIILGSVLLMFVALLIPSKFVLYKWHGVLFIVLYIAYLSLAIGQVYL